MTRTNGANIVVEGDDLVLARPFSKLTPPASTRARIKWRSTAIQACAFNAT